MTSIFIIINISCFPRENSYSVPATDKLGCVWGGVLPRDCDFQRLRGVQFQRANCVVDRLHSVAAYLRCYLRGFTAGVGGSDAGRPVAIGRHIVWRIFLWGGTDGSVRFQRDYL